MAKSATRRCTCGRARGRHAHRHSRTSTVTGCNERRQLFTESKRQRDRKDTSESAMPCDSSSHSLAAVCISKAPRANWLQFKHGKTLLKSRISSGFLRRDKWRSFSRKSKGGGGCADGGFNQPLDPRADGRPGDISCSRCGFTAVLKFTMWRPPPGPHWVRTCTIITPPTIQQRGLDKRNLRGYCSVAGGGGWTRSAKGGSSCLDRPGLQVRYPTSQDPPPSSGE